MTVSTINLKLKPGPGSLAASWEANSTVGLSEWLLHFRPIAVPPVPWTSVNLKATVRAYSITGLQAESYEVQVRPVLAGGAQTVTAMPLREPAKAIIGVNGGSTWGKMPAEQFTKAGITSERIEIGRDSIAESVACGFKNQLAVIGNTPNGTPLSQIPLASWLSSTVAQAKECAAAGITLLEVGNEMYGKGKWPNHEGALYGRMLLSLCEACKGLGVTLLANLYQSKSGADWLEPMLTAAPQLKTLLGGFTAHPYGVVGWDYGEGGMRYQLALAAKLGVQNTDVYVTEYGVECEGTSKEPGFTSSDPVAQAARLKEMLDALTANPSVKMIQVYGSHDESSAPPPCAGRWGLITHQGVVRPALAVAGSYSH